MLKFNAPLALGVLLLAAQSASAQIVLITDNFNSNSNTNGRATTTGNVQHIANDYNTGRTATYDTTAFAASYTGNNTNVDVVPLSGFTLGNSTTVQADIFFNKGNAPALGFSGAAVGMLTQAAASNANSPNSVNYGGGFGVLSATTNSLSIVIPNSNNLTNTGQLLVNGGQAATFSLPNNFTLNALNTFELAYNSGTQRATIIVDGTTVLSNFDVGFLVTSGFTLNYAGFAENYGAGYNGNTTNDFTGFDNLAVSTAVPEPGTYATMLLGMGGLFLVLRRRTRARG